MIHVWAPRFLPSSLCIKFFCLEFFYSTGIKTNHKTETRCKYYSHMISFSGLHNLYAVSFRIVNCVRFYCRDLFPRTFKNDNFFPMAWNFVDSDTCFLIGDFSPFRLFIPYSLFLMKFNSVHLFQITSMLDYRNKSQISPGDGHPLRCRVRFLNRGRIYASCSQFNRCQRTLFCKKKTWKCSSSWS